MFSKKILFNIIICWCYALLPMMAQEVLYTNTTFEDGVLPSDWSILSNATDGGYKVGYAPQLSSSYAPFPSHTQFIATNDDACNCDKSNEQLILPTFDFSNATVLFLKFDFFFFNGDYNGIDEQAWIEYSADGVTFTSYELSTLYPSGQWNNNSLLDISELAGSSEAIIRFRYEDNGDWQYAFGLDNISVIKPATVNLAISTIALSEANTCQPSESESIFVEVQNRGYTPVQGATLNVTITRPDATIVNFTQTIEGEIPAFSTSAFTLVAPQDFSQIGDYSISMDIDLTDDEQPEDDTLTQIITHYSGELRINGIASNSSDQRWELRNNNTGELVSTGGRWPKNESINDVTCLDDTACYALKFYSADANGFYPFVAENPSLAFYYNQNLIYTPTSIFNNDYNINTQPSFQIWTIGGGCPTTDIGIEGITVPEIQLQNQTNEAIITIANYGTTSKIIGNLNISIDNGVAIDIATDDVVLEPSKSHTYTVALPTLGVGAHSISSTVSLMTDDEILQQNNTITTSYFVVAEAPARKIVVEGSTGTWCGWCPATAVTFDVIDTSLIIPIEVHNQDILTEDNWAAALDYWAINHPTMVINRTETCAPDLLDNKLTAYKDTDIAAATVSIEATYDEVTRNISATVKANFVATSIQSYRLNCWVVENQVKGAGQAFAQANYYSGGANGTMGGFEFLNDPVAPGQIVYNRAARAQLGGLWGTSIDEAIVVGTTYSETFDYTLPEDFEANQIQLIGVLQAYNDDPRKRHIENAINMALPVTVQVNGIKETDISLEVSPNPTDDVLHIRWQASENTPCSLFLLDVLGNNIYDKKNEYNTQQATLNISQLPAGTYIVQLRIGETVLNKRIVKI